LPATAWARFLAGIVGGLRSKTGVEKSRSQS